MRNLLWITAAFALTSGSAQAASCQIPLRNVLVSGAECAYYQTAFRMMANERVSVNSFCEKGVFDSPAGNHYDTQVVTVLTVNGSPCKALKALSLNPVLLSKPNCERLKRVVGMLTTDYVRVEPTCRFGSWVGADGAPRTSMVSTRLALRRNAR